MANKYPYVPSAGPLTKTVTHLRKSFPKEVTAETLRKLGVAPKNESYVINVLRFLGVLDDEGKKVEAKSAAFLQHQEAAFATEIGKVVKEAYEELFELHGDDAWKLDRGALTQFFRTTDHSSDVVGSRQASTFAALASLSGQADAPVQKVASTSPRKAAAPKPVTTQVAAKSEAAKTDDIKIKPAQHGEAGVGLTVRIEVNLPASGDQATYDAIFRSIRKNLIDGA